MQLARRLGRVDDAVVARQDALLAKLGLKLDPPKVDGQELLRAMHRDKKASAGRLRFVLPDRIGRVELVGDVSDEDVLAAVEL
jgi:3-dehydroquinate synthase